MTTTPFFGRRVVWAAFTIAIFGWGFGFYGPPVFLHAVIARTGWGVGFVSACVTLHFLAGALVITRLPWLHARFGVAAVTSAGAALLAAGVLLWGIVAQRALLVPAAILSGAGWVALGAAGINAMIAPWFVRTRPRALSAAYNGASVGGILFSPLWVALIGALGFGGAALTAGVVMVAVVAWLARSVLRHTPASLGQGPDGDAPGTAAMRMTHLHARALPGTAMWRDRGFVTLAGAMALGLFAQIGLVAHLFSLLVPALGAQGAGLAMGMATGAAIAGRTLAARMMTEHADRRLVACASYAVQLAGSLVLVAAGGESVPLLLLGILLFGVGIGNATSLPPLIAQSEFVAEDVQRAVALIMSMAQAAYAFAPAVFGLVLAFGAQGAALALAGLVQAMAIACMLAGRRPPAAVTSSR